MTPIDPNKLAAALEHAPSPINQDYALKDIEAEEALLAVDRVIVAIRDGESMTESVINDLTFIRRVLRERVTKPESDPGSSGNQS